MNKLEIIGAEVYAVLNTVPKEKYNQIPSKVTDLFEKYKDCSNDVKIDVNKKFEEQNISQEAKDIIFAIALNYWLSEDEKRMTIKKLNINEEKAKEKYDVEKIFKKSDNRANIDSTTKNIAIVETHEKWYKKIFRKIFSIFKK